MSAFKICMRQKKQKALGSQDTGNRQLREWETDKEWTKMERMKRETLKLGENKNVVHLSLFL